MSAKEERIDREPRVVCTACEFSWYSAQMEEGLRALASCPRCGGALRFRDAEASPRPVEDFEPRFNAPHRALGIPRPRPR